MKVEHALWSLLLAASCAHPLRGADPKVGVVLPKDHGAHQDAQTEWWHFHGHVADDDGHRYDWFLTFVKQHTDLDYIAFVPVSWMVDPFYVAYFSISDRSNSKFIFDERVNFPDFWAANAEMNPMAVNHNSWSAKMNADQTIDLVAAMPDGSSLKLKMTPKRAPVLHGRDGYVFFPPNSSHYYYSIPRMTAVGEIVIDSKPRAVRGLGWFKHEWGFLYDEGFRGWAWFGAQLSSGHDLEIAVLMDLDGNVAQGSFCVIEEPDGGVTRVPIRVISIEETGRPWRSPRTDVVYPTAWRIEIPERGLLELRAPVEDQEMVVFPTNLWAGTLTVDGVFDGQEVEGNSFTEVVGLDQPFGRWLFKSGKSP